MTLLAIWPAAGAQSPAVPLNLTLGPTDRLSRRNLCWVSQAILLEHEGGMHLKWLAAEGFVKGVGPTQWLEAI